MTEWYEQDAFWDEISDRLFTEDHWARAENEINDIIVLLGARKGNKVLDLCCGPGRHSIELAKKRLIVTSVDRTSSYIDNVKKLAIENNVDIECIIEDMRKFRRTDTFDIVLNLYTSFGFFPNRDDGKFVLYNVYSSLKKSGKFLIDMMGKEDYPYYWSSTPRGPSSRTRGPVPSRNR